MTIFRTQQVGVAAIQFKPRPEYFGNRIIKIIEGGHFCPKGRAKMLKKVHKSHNELKKCPKKLSFYFRNLFFVQLKLVHYDS